MSTTMIEGRSAEQEQATADSYGRTSAIGPLLKMADDECEHGRLPGDRTEPCGCWPPELERSVA